MSWPPHITVATIVQRNDRYLMVEEADNGASVLNQPAGHLEPGESIAAAARRETREETGWEIRLTGFGGIYLYYSATADITYQRINFIAEPVVQASTRLDPDIIATHWLSLEELRQRELRSPMVIRSIEDALRRPALPLEYVTTLPLAVGAQPHEA